MHLRAIKAWKCYARLLLAVCPKPQILTFTCLVCSWRNSSSVRIELPDNISWKIWWFLCTTTLAKITYLLMIIQPASLKHVLLNYMSLTKSSVSDLSLLDVHRWCWTGLILIHLQTARADSPERIKFPERLRSLGGPLKQRLVETT